MRQSTALMTLRYPRISLRFRIQIRGRVPSGFHKERLVNIGVGNKVVIKIMNKHASLITHYKEIHRTPTQATTRQARCWIENCEQFLNSLSNTLHFEKKVITGGSVLSSNFNKPLKRIHMLPIRYFPCLPPAGLFYSPGSIGRAFQ